MFIITMTITEKEPKCPPSRMTHHYNGHSNDKDQGRHINGDTKRFPVKVKKRQQKRIKGRKGKMIGLKHKLISTKMIEMNFPIKETKS